MGNHRGFFMPRPRWPERGDVPWSPGPFRQSPFELARWMAGRGATEEQIRRHLAMTRPEMLPMNIARAAEFGYRWGNRVRSDQAINPDQRPVRSWMMRDSDQTPAYRFWVDVDFGIDETGTRNVRTVAIESERNLTYEQIYERASALFLEIAERYERFRGLPITDQTIFLLVHATRRS